MRQTVVVWIGLGVLLASAWSDPPPTPSIVPASWQLEFEHEPLQSIRLVPPGRTEPQTYWYLLFEVRNRTGADRDYVPEFVLYADTGKVLEAGRGVPTLVVFEAIQKRHNNPLLMNLTDISRGRLLQGADNAKEGVAIWSGIDPQARAFDVFIGGLSGEQATVKLPAPVMVEERDEKGQVRRVARAEVTLFKTLKLSYGLPGEPPARAKTRPRLLKKEWVMR